MNLIEQINLHEYLYLNKLVEINDIELELWINEAKVQGNRNNLPKNTTFYGSIETD